MIIGSPEKNTKSMEPVLFIENAGAALRYYCYFNLLQNMFVVLDIQVLGVCFICIMAYRYTCCYNCKSMFLWTHDANSVRVSTGCLIEEKIKSYNK